MFDSFNRKTTTNKNERYKEVAIKKTIRMKLKEKEIKMEVEKNATKTITTETSETRVRYHEEGQSVKWKIEREIYNE